MNRCNRPTSRRADRETEAFSYRHSTARGAKSKRELTARGARVMGRTCLLEILQPEFRTPAALIRFRNRGTETTYFAGAFVDGGAGVGGVSAFFSQPAIKNAPTRLSNATT